jgi:hypothetical protein
MATLIYTLLVGSAAAEDAETLYKRGVELFNKGDFKEAAQSFRSAYELRPSWRIFYNIAQSEASAKRYGLALEAFESYLTGGGDEIEFDRKEAVLAELDRLRKMVGSLEVKTKEGATIFVDGVERGEAPLIGKLAVSASQEHTTYAVIDGKETKKKRFKIRGGDTLAVHIGDEKTSNAEKPDATPQGDRPPRTRYEQIDTSTPSDDKPAPLAITGGIFAGLGAGALIAGIVTGVRTNKLDESLKKDCPDGNCPASLNDKIDKMENTRFATNVLLISGGTLAAAGVAMLVVHLVKRKKSRRAATVMLAPDIGEASLGFHILKRF